MPALPATPILQVWSVVDGTLETDIQLKFKGDLTHFIYLDQEDHAS